MALRCPGNRGSLLYATCYDQDHPPPAPLPHRLPALSSTKHLPFSVPSIPSPPTTSQYFLSPDPDTSPTAFFPCEANTQWWRSPSCRRGYACGILPCRNLSIRSSLIVVNACALYLAKFRKFSLDSCASVSMCCAGNEWEGRREQQAFLARLSGIGDRGIGRLAAVQTVSPLSSSASTLDFLVRCNDWKH